MKSHEQIHMALQAAKVAKTALQMLGVTDIVLVRIIDLDLAYEVKALTDLLRAIQEEK